MKKVDETIILSRSLWCPICSRLGRPHSGNLFAVWRHDHEDMIIKTCHQGNISGVTPHFIIYDTPYKVIGGKVLITQICGMDNCGIEIDTTQPNATVRFVKENLLWLPENDFLALVNKWHGNTGYNLI